MRVGWFWRIVAYAASVCKRVHSTREAGAPSLMEAPKSPSMSGSMAQGQGHFEGPGPGDPQ